MSRTSYLFVLTVIITNFFYTRKEIFKNSSTRTRAPAKFLFPCTGFVIRSNLAPKTAVVPPMKNTHRWKGSRTEPVGLIVYVSVVITDNPRGEESTGEVSIQVDLFTHPGTGEHKVTVKGKI